MSGVAFQGTRVMHLRLRSWPVRLIFVIAICGLAWLPLALYVYRLNAPRYIKNDAPFAPQMQLESKHFLLQFPQGYMSKAALNGFLARAEATQVDLKSFLNPPDSNENQKIKIYLLEGQGVSSSGKNYIYLYYLREGHIPIAHELTHILMGQSPSRLLTDGLAVYCQARFGDFDFPNYNSPVEVATLGRLRQGNFLSLADLSENVGFIGETRRLAYLESGSFAGYLIDRYGYPQFRQVYYSNDFQQVYATSLDELERDWLGTLWRENLVVTALYLAVGILCLFLISFSLKRASLLWLLIAAVALVALGVFDLYSYSRFPSRLALALQILLVFAVLLRNKLSPKWLWLLVWVPGLSLLAYSEISALLNMSVIALGK